MTSLRAREVNIRRLQAHRARLHDELLSTLAGVRELVTRIHLAKYTGAPASRAEELVMQIAMSIESLADVSAWQDDGSVPELLEVRDAAGLAPPAREEASAAPT